MCILDIMEIIPMHSFTIFNMVSEPWVRACHSEICVC